MATLIKINKEPSFDPNLIELELYSEFSNAHASAHDVSSQDNGKRDPRKKPSMVRSKSFMEAYVEQMKSDKEGIEGTVKKIRLDGIEAWSMSTTRSGKIFWTILICIASLTTAYYLYKTVYEYWSSKPVTTFNIVPMTEMQFPHIYICPNVDYSSFEFSGNEEMSSNKEAIDAANFFRQNDSLCKSRRQPSRDENIDEIFMKCTFRKFSHNEEIPCASIVRPIIDAETRSTCFLVNFQKDRQRCSGRGLLLGINQSRSSRDPCAAARGVKVIVSKAYVFGSYQSTFVAPGTFTDLNLKSQYYQFENVLSGPSPQPCVSAEDFRLKFFAGNYSRRACLKECEYEHVSRRCRCVPKMDPYYLNENLTENFCKDNDDACVEEAKKSDLAACQSGCYEPCRLWRYPVQTSFQPLNSKKFGMNDTRDLIYLHVAFGQMEVEEYVQSPSETIDGMISDIGGQVNLWLGASMVTLIQIPALISIIAAWYFYGNVSKIQLETRRFTR